MVELSSLWFVKILYFVVSMPVVALIILTTLLLIVQQIKPIQIRVRI